MGAVEEGTGMIGSFEKVTFIHWMLGDLYTFGSPLSLSDFLAFLIRVYCIPSYLLSLLQPSVDKRK